MIHELRTYTVAPGMLPGYVKMSGEIGRKARGDTYGTLLGYWTTEFGTLNQAVHLWQYPSLDERDRLRGELAKNENWTKGYLPRTRGMILAQENKILTPVLPTQAPADRGNVYELRWYRAHVGRVPEWLSLFKAVMPTRDKYMRRVGLWQTEMGQLNEVVHMWVFRDLNERAEQRARLAQDPEWQQFLAAGASLLAHMQAAVLLPAAHSPMK